MYSRLDNLINRRLVVDELPFQLSSESKIASLNQSESVRYALISMQEIDPKYTANTINEAKRVINQLSKELHADTGYRYQGSVSNNTHIKGRSDIDVLTLCHEFITLEPPQKASSLYKGDVIVTLKTMKKTAITTLRSAFPTATVENNAKSIKITGGSLRRDIDVVPSNWYDSNRYSQTSNEVYRGIQILDSVNDSRVCNYPFLHNALIDQKDRACNGGLRKAIRLMKTLKYESELDGPSSYDICALAYNMDSSLLLTSYQQDLAIVYNCFVYCSGLMLDKTMRDSLKVPNETRKVFCDEGCSRSDLESLTDELKALIRDIESENKRDFRKIAAERIGF